MNNKIINTLMFIAGAAVGSGVTWYVLKTKYQQIANEEIEEMREFYRSKLEDLDDSDNTEPLDESMCIVDESEVEENFTEYSDIIKQSGYSGEIKKGGTKVEKKPYVISPEDFDTVGYAAISLTYYADGTVVNDDDEVLNKEDIESLIGEDSLTHFGEYEDDSVFVRNDELEADYEILLDQRRYSDVYYVGPDKDD